MIVIHYTPACTSFAVQQTNNHETTTPNMKKFLTILACAAFIGTASAQTNAASTATPSAVAPSAMKEHVCSATCTPQAHAYVHGEKGHACTDACKTASTTKAAGCCAGKAAGASCAKGEGKAEAHTHADKAHACSDACKDGKHAYACGEKGHECGTACAHKH